MIFHSTWEGMVIPSEFANFIQESVSDTFQQNAQGIISLGLGQCS